MGLRKSSPFTRESRETKISTISTTLCTIPFQSDQPGQTPNVPFCDHVIVNSRQRDPMSEGPSEGQNKRKKESLASSDNSISMIVRIESST